MRSLSWLVLLAVVVVAMVIAVVDDGPARTNSEVAYAIADDYACPVCDGQSVAESDVPIARSIRREINQRVDAGASDAEIRSYLVSRYGEEIDLRPRGDGIVGVVWFLPVVVVVVASAGMIVAFRRWSRRPDVARDAEADARLVEDYRSRPSP